MTQCKSCRKPVDRTASTCPHCGAAKPRWGWPNPTSPVLLLFPAMLGFTWFGLPAVLDGYAKGKQERLARHAAEAMHQAVALEKAYYAKHGEYSINLDEATGPNWTMPDDGAYRLLLLSGSGDTFCLEAGPGTDLNVLPLSMDQDGVLYHDGGCPQPKPPANETPEQGALRVVRSVYRQSLLWNARHPDRPFDPSTDDRLKADDVPDEYTITVGGSMIGKGPGQFCFALNPKDEHSALQVIAVDEKGKLYHENFCQTRSYGAVTAQD
jgi:hypothetical protein